TQMTVHNREGVAWAASHGFSRVVLARELQVSEIREIASAPECRDTGLEVFVHGALCYSYSGQCLLSSLIGGRSGNRGMCAQPCRKPYVLLEGGQDHYGRMSGMKPVEGIPAYPLSTRDLSVYRVLGDLAGLGLRALKIEGRMRSPRYVALVTDVYRRAIDAIDSGDFSPSDEDEVALTLAFSRGFTPGWLMGSRHRGLLGNARPDNVGLFLGEVVSSDSRSGLVKVRPVSAIVPETGDGVVFVDPLTGKEEGFPLTRDARLEDGCLILPSRAGPGACVWLTRKASLVSRAEAIISRKRPLIPIDLLVTWDGQVPALSGKISGLPGKDALDVVYRPEQGMEPSRGREVGTEEIRRQLMKTGGTRFSILVSAIEYPGGLFAPVSYLNALRRDFLGRAESAIAGSFLPGNAVVEETGKRCRKMREVLRSPGKTHGDELPAPPLVISLYTDDPGAVREAVAAGCRSICFEPDPRTGHRRCLEPGLVRTGDLAELLSEVSAICTCAGASLTWKWPRITRRDYLDAALPIVEAGAPYDAIMLESTGVADALARKVQGIVLTGGSGLNVMNSCTIRTLSPLFRRLTISPEITGTELASLLSCSGGPGVPGLDVIVQGNLEVMVGEECLLARKPGLHGGSCTGYSPSRTHGLRDGSGRIFPFRIDAACRTHIYNAVETCLVDRVPTLARQGVTGIAIDGRGRGPAYAAEMVRIYLEAAQAVELPAEETERRISTLRERVRQISQGGITAGYMGSLREPVPGSPDQKSSLP
ncbi:MAG: DUF3656 domain-containing protein, partial [Methanoregulaceae archaeon]|nr:DUF3656 domain-containing protein [Methanoregulaceae archaeon]